MVNEQGKVCKNQEDVMEFIQHYYSKLFKGVVCEINDMEKLTEVIEKKLTIDDKKKNGAIETSAERR